MQPNEILPDLFRTEYRKIVSVLSKHFGFAQLDMAEDIAGDTFLTASETWGQKGIPANPTAWLYQVAKNKAKNAVRCQRLFATEISAELKQASVHPAETDLDLSPQNITDSQLQMMFAICHPVISTEVQIGLSLRILCGFGLEEIADAFLSSKETIHKRLLRAKAKLRDGHAKIEFPVESALETRLSAVLTTIYLLFNEGYYSKSQNKKLRKDLCLEAMRLCLMLVDCPLTNTPAANALLSLMCFHASRFEARLSPNGEPVLYADQDVSLWDADLIQRGEHFLNEASYGKTLTKYHLEAAIAFWHTRKTDTAEKWESILHLYNQRLLLEYSPIAALNRTYALSKTVGKKAALPEALKLNLNDNIFYFMLLGDLYTDIDNLKAKANYQKALSLAKGETDKNTIAKKIQKLLVD